MLKLKQTIRLPCECQMHPVGVIVIQMLHVYNAVAAEDFKCQIEAHFGPLLLFVIRQEKGGYVTA